MWSLPAFWGLTHPYLPIPHQNPACCSSFQFSRFANSFLSQSFYTSSVSCLNCSFCLPLHGQLVIFQVATWSYFLKGSLPSKYTDLNAQTYNTLSPFTSLKSSPMLWGYMKGKPILDFQITTHAIVCLLSFSFTRKVFWLCMFCFFLYVFSEYFKINECGYQFKGYTTLLLNTNQM